MIKYVAPSLLSADFNNLGHDIDMVNRSEADWFHLDIMDGVFVPNISFGFPVIEHIAKLAKKPLDVHLMIVEPDKFLERFSDVGANILTVHWEACTHLHRTLSRIRQLGMKAGVSLNPHTPVELLDDILQEADLVLIMSVNPGFGGQKFIERSMSRISRLREMIDKGGYSTLIEVDGGVGTHNAAELYAAGANVLVAGNAVFKSENPAETIRAIKNA
ncbi:MAG: ribulose-phosphate 3-epimerase [Tenuifilaceae bacterium]|jgi:ribulose-phosphate 3-epimerase|nr:ribulose-phosphate 3-epimerase [Bacteroidota bacterium]MZP83271.1 ribulose-phosphate 3-epimerase [Bacteroidales bacterium]NLH55561.1 ribulose-phosphate 3-epimerase [Rikenellaceae bacterium]HOF92254.1 ribulose-phosphate 3-epimerase [Tenuifilaceae bacterium]HOM85672.1 ribulose-phosphate 3-epimerase [Tenuifilaceae bacterium]